MSRPIPEHGHANRYAYGCRCKPCTKAATRADAERKLDRLAGRPRQIPAGPAAAHARALLDRGLTLTQIAREAGTEAATVRRVVNGQREVLAVTAKKILSVSLDVRVSLGDVPAVGAMRRIRALYALGHLNWLIAQEAGVSRDAICSIAAGKWLTIKVKVDDGIRAAYDRLSMKTGTSWKTRNLAAKKGWVSPLAWDDDAIDDPQARPQVDTDAVAEGDDDVDQVAVAKFVKGFRVEVTDAEFLAGVQQCVAMEMTAAAIDQMHGWEKKTTENRLNKLRKQYQRSGRDFPNLSRPSVRSFSEKEVVAIRERSAAGSTDVEVALSFDTSRETIRAICRGQRYPQYGGPIRDKRSARGLKASREYMCGHATNSRAAINQNEMEEAA